MKTKHKEICMTLLGLPFMIPEVILSMLIRLFNIIYFFYQERVLFSLGRILAKLFNYKEED